MRLPTDSRTLGLWLGAVAITVAACALVHDHTRLDSASFDEPSHIHAAYLQVFHHNGISNMEHPPLAKEVAGLGLLFCRPADTPAEPNLDFPNSGRRFLFGNRISPDTILAAARTPMLVFFASVCLLVFGVARRFFGSVAGFLALFLIAFEPTLLAHAGIVHTDVPVSLFWLASVMAWGRVLERRSPGRVAVAGLLLGGALATKFSAIYLLPTFALVALAIRAVNTRKLPRTDSPSRLSVFGGALGRDLLAGIGTAAIGFTTVLLVYQVVVSGFSVAQQQAVIRRMVGGYERAPVLANRLAAISPVSKALAHFLGGIAVVGRQSAVGGGLSFLNGKISVEGFPFYFFEAFAVKTAIPFLLLSVAALGLLPFRRVEPRDALLWVPVLYYFLFSMGSSYNIGIRHLLPVYPFLAIAGSRVPHEIASRFPGMNARRKAVAIGAVVLLAAFQVATALSAHPFELSYFNTFGGGTGNGYRLLTDSNTDWGIDLRRLAIELNRRKVSTATICYFGVDPVQARTGIPDFTADGRLRGDFVTMSTTLWDIGPAFYAVNHRPDLGRRLSLLIRLLRTRGTFVGRIGGSTLLYRLPVAPDPISDILRR
ncbi:MAG TPA: glycosyltransferase family 39 protein [Thermoanaerobaculia bacterium]|nr:glycosyltransferase family 39 protein [Thermoanaerobaculia bacterium]